MQGAARRAMVGRDTHPKESAMKHELPYEIENKCLLTLEEARAQLAHVEKKLAVAKTPENEVEWEGKRILCKASEQDVLSIAL